jgi:hypothetical protein
VHGAQVSFGKYLREELHLGTFAQNEDGNAIKKDLRWGAFDGDGNGNNFLRLIEELVSRTLRGPHRLRDELKEAKAIPPALRVLLHTLNNHAHVLWPMKSRI